MATTTQRQRKQNGERLRKAIDAAGMNQYELAYALQISESQVSRWVNGAKPHRLMQREIAQTLDAKPEEIWS